jgi:hypothetical protein
MLAATGAAALIVGSATLVLAPSATAASVTPTKVDGNPKCPVGLTELKIEEQGSPPKDGTYSSDDDKFVVTIDVDATGQNFNFTVTTGTALVVYAKGGDAANEYDYRPGGSTADTVLHAPEKNGHLPELSHISFCYGETTTPTSPPTSAPTSPPTSEPTSPPTSPPTSQPTSQPTSPPSTPTLPPTEQPSTPTLPPTEQPSTPTESPTESPSESPSGMPTGSPTESESPSPGLPTDIDAGQGGDSGDLNLLGGNGSGPSALGIGLLAAGAAMVAGGVVLTKQRRGRHSA